MAHYILASTHVSSLYPISKLNVIPVDTRRRDVPIAEPDPSLLLEHASFASVFSHKSTVIFIRVIHGGLVLELTPTTSNQPVRFSFPSPIILAPTLLLHQLSELRVFVVTTSGSLFTLVFPVSPDDNSPIFDVAFLSRDWYREYLIAIPTEDLEGPVHVKDIDCVVVGLSKGRFLRLDCESDFDSWQETVHRVRTGWTSFLGSDPEESQIICVASHPPPTDSVLIFTLSRDYTLRAWSQGHCVASYTMKNTMRSSSTPALRGETPGNEHRGPLLGSEPRTLIRVLEYGDDENHVDDNLRLLVFIPNPASPESSGWFHLFRMTPGRGASKDIYHIRSIACSSQSAGAELRDFGVHRSLLYALWDQTGQPMVEFTSFEPEVQEDSEEGQEWHSASYPTEAELTPDYLDELLLRSGGGSLVDTFLSVILRPGIFSQFTIETALQQYIEALASIPGERPRQLGQSYITLSEHIAAVVGCTVNLTVDPRTGISQRDNYWNALKRDWEGFVARCRDIERSGRWPLSLGITDEGVLILERERLGRLVMADRPLEVQHLLQEDQDNEELALLRLGLDLRQSLSNAEIYARESQFDIMVSQEHSYSFPESLDHCIASTDEPREDLTENVLEQLRNYPNLVPEFSRALDMITSIHVVKNEENEDILPLNSTRWTRGIATSFINATTEARYELCVNLILLLFQIDTRHHELPPALLSRIFVTFRNLSILRFLTWQPAGDPDGTTTISDDQEAAMIRGLQSMSVSHRATLAKAVPVTYSLMHRLMDEDREHNAIERLPHDMGSLHLSRLGLLGSIDVAEVSHLEVSLCKWLFDLGFRDVALEIIGRLPRSVGITYVHGLILVQIGRTEDGASMLQRVGAKFGSGFQLPEEDDAAMKHVLPTLAASYTEYGYYRWIGIMFEGAHYLSESVRFYKLAIESADAGIDTSDLWRKVIGCYTELDMFEDAYMALVTAPYETIKREAVSQLVQAMCEASAVDRLLSLNFVGLPNEVESALSFKVRNADPLHRPMYHQVLYAWYVFRGDLRNAAATMYQHARRLDPLLDSSPHFVEIANLQLESYLVALNALSLIDPKSAWISLPIPPGPTKHNRKRRKLSKHIPVDKYRLETRDAEVIELSDLRYEYTLVKSRLDLVKRDPNLLATSQHFLTDAQIVSKYAQAGSYDYAMSAARSLDVDMTELFERLTLQCLRLARRGESYLQDPSSEWLHSERVSSWPGTPIERGWRYLRISLEQHDTAAKDYAYRKAVVEKMLEFDRDGALPSWLVKFFQEHEPEYLVRTCLRFDLVREAVEYSLDLVKKANAPLSRLPAQRASSTWLPYNLIDAVIDVTRTHKNLTPETHNQLGELQREVASRVKRLQKLSASQ
ncbi:hypothetical protein M422DRAFT_236708 [Sphaerobolus stellatus SS14]|uniref:Unplaced genomic scaffold SPHSTscaffold_312, whole genome shotgun sequence n=1 Tax=Sphaerobolus stellatus (strain SS14) TaxID=990650 RepID=A0A0C9TAC3_SPHS4|nr:hypothetical protein M422DRAFT_236708 [Sphaerobolus stellatus SS14]